MNLSILLPKILLIPILRSSHLRYQFWLLVLHSQSRPVETQSKGVWERVGCVFCTVFHLLLFVKHKVFQVFALVIVTGFLLFLWKRLALCHWHEGQVEVLIFFLLVHEGSGRMLQNDTGAFFTFGLDLLFSLRLTLAHDRAYWQFSWLTQMLRELFCHFVRILRVAGKLVGHGSVIGLAFVELGVRYIVHEGRLFEGFLIPLLMVGKTREVMFELVFQSSCFIYLKVWFVLYVKHVLSCLYIIPIIGGGNTNICGACWQRFV